MAEKELRFSFDDPRLKNSQLITELVETAAKRLGMDLSKNDCLEVIDDPDRRQRVYRLKTRTVTVY